MLTIHDEGFKKFGCKIDVDTKEILEYLSKIELPKTGNIYVASDTKFESLKEIQRISKEYYAEEVEAGYCCGRNELMNCVEFHGCPEINIALEDCTLFLGTISQFENKELDSSLLEEVLVKKGEAIMLYPSILHFSPCRIEEGFHMAVLLTKGTNTPISEEEKKNGYWMKNKWLIAHKDTKQAALGAMVGIRGENRRGSMVK